MACFRRIAAADLSELQRFLLVNCVESYIQLSGRDAVDYARLAERAENGRAVAMQLTWAEKMEAKYRKQGLVEGRSEALEQLRAIVLYQLEQRFGPLPERTKRRIRRLRSLRSLRQIAEQVLVANSLRDLGLS